jgi:flagellar hook-length control protein FliK
MTRPTTTPPEPGNTAPNAAGQPTAAPPTAGAPGVMATGGHATNGTGTAGAAAGTPPSGANGTTGRPPVAGGNPPTSVINLTGGAGSAAPAANLTAEPDSTQGAATGSAAASAAEQGKRIEAGGAEAGRGGSDARPDSSDEGTNQPAPTPATPGIAPTVPTARPEAVAAPAPAPAGTPTPATQLAVQIAPLRLGADGVHRMTIHLNPQELGPISVIAEVRNGDIAVRLTGATEIGREALQAALPDLRKELQDAGSGSTTLDIGQDGGSRHSRQQNEPRSTRTGTEHPAHRAPAAETRQPTPQTSPTSAQRTLDLHV